MPHSICEPLEKNHMPQEEPSGKSEQPSKRFLKVWDEPFSSPGKPANVIARAWKDSAE